MKTIKENNRMIAEFMGYETYEQTDNVAIRLMDGNEFNSTDIGHVHTKFHTSYEWLMPVWKHINSISGSRFTFPIRPDFCYILDFETVKEIVYNEHGATNEELIYETVVQFIEWYNKNK